MRLQGPSSKNENPTLQGNSSHLSENHQFVKQSFNTDVDIRDDYGRFNEVCKRAQDLKIGVKTKINYKTIDSRNQAIEVEQPIEGAVLGDKGFENEREVEREEWLTAPLFP